MRVGQHIMRISHAEQLAIQAVLDAGAAHGYGNMISHLQTRWAEMLMKQWGMDEKSARAASGGDGYPFEMQHDLLLRGGWDETGENYRSANNSDQKTAPIKRGVKCSTRSNGIGELRPRGRFRAVGEAGSTVFGTKF